MFALLSAWCSWNCNLKSSAFVRSPLKISGVLPTRRVGTCAAAAIAGAGAIGWGAGNCGATGCTNGGSSGSWMTSPYSSCSSRTGTSCPGCSGDGSSVALSLFWLSGLSDSSRSEGWRDWVNAGELTTVAVASAGATNAERVGSSDSVDTVVSTVRAGAPDGPASYPSGNWICTPSRSAFLICSSRN